MTRPDDDARTRRRWRIAIVATLMLTASGSWFLLDYLIRPNCPIYEALMTNGAGDCRTVPAASLLHGLASVAIGVLAAYSLSLAVHAHRRRRHHRHDR